MSVESSLPLACARLLLGITATLFLMLPRAQASDEWRTEEDASIVPITTMFTEREALPQTGTTAVLMANGHYQVTTRFRSFEGDPLSLAFTLSQDSTRQSAREYGVSTAELDALVERCRAKKGCNQQEFDRFTTRYYQAHGMRLSYAAGETPKLHVDVAKAVQRNRDRVKPLAAALRGLAAEHGQDRQWLIDTAIALVQSGLVYRQPDTWDEGRKILGFYPPPRALQRGYGDCDTKAALLASILQNLTDARLIGVHVPKHYLLGIAGTPAAGQRYLEYRGQTFVLVEAAGPARRPPGDVAPATQTALARMEGVRIDPMF